MGLSLRLGLRELSKGARMESIFIDISAFEVPYIALGSYFYDIYKIQFSLYLSVI